MLKLKKLQELAKIKGKTALVRVDFNVPLKNGRVGEDSRIRAVLPTLQYLLKKKAGVVLVTHIGRPEGKIVAELSVKPVAKRLSTLLDHPVSVVDFDPLQPGKIDIEPGEIILLENIRFFAEEEKNDSGFARALASLADLFVFDGFAVSHRDAASVSGAQKYLPSYAGLLVEKEIQNLEKIFSFSARPRIGIIGGAKIETKLPVIKKLFPIIDSFLIGGALVNTYLKAKGYGVGISLVDNGYEKHALQTFSKKKIFLPVDVVVGEKDGKKKKVVELLKNPHEVCKKNESVLDIGPKTIHQYLSIIKEAKMVVWNGSMGYFENKSFSDGTFAVAHACAKNKKSFSVVGGGETVQVIEKLKLSSSFDFVSTGGGAMLEFLSGKKLPGLKKILK